VLSLAQPLTQINAGGAQRNQDVWNAPDSAAAIHGRILPCLATRFGDIAGERACPA